MSTEPSLSQQAHLIWKLGAHNASLCCDYTAAPTLNWQALSAGSVGCVWELGWGGEWDELKSPVCKEPKIWRKCSVGGQPPSALAAGVCHPQRPRSAASGLTADLSAPPPPHFIQSARASLVGSRQCSRRCNSSYLSTWRPCQNVRPGDIPHAAGLLAKKTGRMVGAGACCHRPVKQPESGNQEALSLSQSPSWLVCMLTLLSYLYAAFPLISHLISLCHSQFSVLYLHL